MHDFCPVEKQLNQIIEIMKKFMLVALIAFFGFSAFKFATVWKNDPAHSEIHFTVGHLGVSEVSGYFKDFTTTFTGDATDFSDAQVTFTAQVNSLDTRV